MSLISFKNVGVKQFATQNILTTPASISPIGIKTPVEFGQNSEGLFAMLTDIRDVVHDNLRNLLLTNHGGRVINFDLGADLQPLVAEFTSKEDFDAEAMIRINTAVSKFMPYVTLVGFDSKPEFIPGQNIFTGRILLFLVYSVPSLNVVERGLELLLFVI